MVISTCSQVYGILRPSTSLALALSVKDRRVHTAYALVSALSSLRRTIGNQKKPNDVHKEISFIDHIPLLSNR